MTDKKENKSSATPKVFYASDSFLSAIKDSDKDKKSSLRVLKEKLYIPENSLEQILSLYEAWLINAGAGSYSREKLLSRVFGETNHSLYYLPEGNDCSIGFIANLAPGASTSSDLGVVSSNSVPIAAADYLHPRDNSYANIEGVELKRPYNQALQIILSSKKNSFAFTESLFRKVVSILRKTHKIEKSYPHISRSLRDALTPLRDTLSQAKFVKPSQIFLVPEQYKNDSSVKFFRVHNMVLVVKDTQAIDVYENRGPGLFEFIDNELRYLTEKKSVKSIDVFQINSRDRFVIGRLKIAGKWFSLDKKGFRFLIENAFKSRWLRDKLDGLFTVKDLIEKMVAALKNADWVDVSQLGRQAGKDNKPKFELKYTPWTFKTGKNFTIVDYVEGGSGFTSRAK